MGVSLGNMTWEIQADLAPFKKNLAVAKSEMQVASQSMASSSGVKNLEKDVTGLGKSAAGGIPILGSLGSSIGGLPLPLMGAAAAAGGLFIAGKSMVDISDKWQAAQEGLKQATDATGVSNQKARDFVEGFISTNRKYVSSQAEVVDSYAALTRQGLSQKTAQQDLNLALDLSAIKHISLKDATTALQGAEAGRGKALVALGIQMKDYPVLMESQHQADKKLEAAEKAVEKATAAHTAAVKAHGAASPQAKAAAAALADANAKLAEAHNYAKERAAASAEIHDQLTKKLQGGRNETSQLTQTQNQLGNVWQTFAEKVGPALTSMLAGVEEVLIAVVSWITDAIVTMTSWHGVWDVVGKIISEVAGFVWKFHDVLLVLTGPIGILIILLENIVTHFQDISSAVQDVIHFLGQIKVPKIDIPGVGGVQGFISHPFGRQAGGAVLPGGIYTVGESGIETLVMGARGGYVIPHGAAAGAGGGGITLVQNIYGNVMRERELLSWARDGIRRLDRAQT